MAQGTIKKPSTSKPSNAKAGVLRKGALKFKPKNNKLIKQAKINKKFTSGLTAQTEKMLGERAGHLEMLGGGKKKGTGKEAGKAKINKKG